MVLSRISLYYDKKNTIILLRKKIEYRENMVNKMTEQNETEQTVVWYAYIQWEHDVLYMTETKEHAERIAKEEWEDYPIVIKSMKVKKG